MTLNKRIVSNSSLAAIAIYLTSSAAFAQENIKIAFIDPLSGGGATIGEIGLKQYQYMAEEINSKGGAANRKFEVIGYDNKANPQESLIQAQKAVDAGIRIITQGNGSSVAAALTDWVAKYNERNPGKEVLYLNYAAIDPVLTNEKCNFWHFRWDASADIKMEALTNFIKPRKEIKKIYLINQDYSFGHSVRKAAVQMLKAKRPDIEIVGDEVHPLLKVTDFAPYIAKIRASGADSVITGNWSQDMGLLLKAAADAGLNAEWFTYYAVNTGSPTAIRQAGLNHKVFAVVEGFPNLEYAPQREWEKAFRAKYNVSVIYPRAVNEMRMLVAAINKAGTTETNKVAAALEGMKFDVYSGGSGVMRKEDHQFFQPMYVDSFGERDAAKEPFDEEGTGWGWRPVAKVAAEDTIVPTTCAMKRP